MRRYAPNHHAICPQYQAPGKIEKRDTQGIRPYALCVFCATPHSSWLSLDCSAKYSYGIRIPCLGAPDTAAYLLKRRYRPGLWAELVSGGIDWVVKS
eukprot:COSAG02_NODE_671_length_18661_cov_9.755953_9_plen_97_part_00